MMKKTNYAIDKEIKKEQQNSHTPIIVIQVSSTLTIDMAKIMTEKINNFLSGTGVKGFVVDCCDVAEVRAFGLPKCSKKEWDSIKLELERRLFND